MYKIMYNIFKKHALVTGTNVPLQPYILYVGFLILGLVGLRYNNFSVCASEESALAWEVHLQMENAGVMPVLLF